MLPLRALTCWRATQADMQPGRKKAFLVPALLGTLVKVLALDSVRLVAEEGAQRLAQSGIEHPG